MSQYTSRMQLKHVVEMVHLALSQEIGPLSVARCQNKMHRLSRSVIIPCFIFPNPLITLLTQHCLTTVPQMWVRERALKRREVDDS